MENQTRIIDVNGVKMEVDMRHVKVIENYKVGDNIKVLIKEYSDYKSYVGCIIGFDQFEKSPTIVIAYLKTDYLSASIQFLYFNQHTQDAEITTLNDWDIPVTKSDVLKKFNKEIEDAEQKIKETENKKEVFEKLFGKYFDKNSIGNKQAETF